MTKMILIRYSTKYSYQVSARVPAVHKVFFKKRIFFKIRMLSPDFVAIPKATKVSNYGCFVSRNDIREAEINNHRDDLFCSNGF
jgi:hypothetical protein